MVGGTRVKLQVAHTKLSYSRAFIIRAYRLQTHEMLFDAHNHAFQGFQEACHVAGSTTTCARRWTRLGAARTRTINLRFLAMTSHYLFEPANSVIRPLGWEKGQVEKNVQDARHRLWQTAPPSGEP